MKDLGMTWKEIMWERSWINIEMILADSARMVKGSEIKKGNTDDLAARIKEKYG